MQEPPLHVHLIFHPESEQGRQLAHDLMSDWMPEPTVPDLRVPVFLTPHNEVGEPPEDGFLDGAQHTLVAVLVDEVMADFVDGNAETWSEWLDQQLRANPIGTPHHFVPVVLDESGFELIARTNAVVALEANATVRRSRISFALSVRALHLLQSGSIEDDDRGQTGQLEAPIKLFVSHAKKDLAEGGLDPVRLTQSALSGLPVREWFDARDIRWGADFGDEIRRGIETAHAIVVFLTDAWSSRPWCVTEGLIAKELGKPVLVVDAIVTGEDRAFPYGGNTRTMRWRQPIEPPETDELEQFRANGTAEGERVIAAAVREALRQVHAQKRLESCAEAEDIVLQTAPEPARIAHEDRAATFLYPDPPVSLNERNLLARVLPDASFVTPMTRFVHRRRNTGVTRLAVSISECEDIHEHGMTMEHVRLITDEVHLYLLLAGLQIVYGGKLDPDKLTSVDDPNNFTLRLFGLVQRYRELAQDAGAPGLHPIVNAAPWPLWKLYDRSVTKVFGRIAKLDKIDLPDDFSIPIDDLAPLDNGFVPPKDPLQLYAWARALTHMRESVTDETEARLCIGGKIEGYKGRMAGLLEEPLIQIERKRPLFLVGALGGCTRLVIDLLEDQSDRATPPRQEMTSDVAKKNVDHYEEIRRLYDEHGGDMPTREDIAARLRSAGAAGPAAALRNGLNDEENRLLFRTTDPATIAELVLRGMEKL